MPHKRLLGDLTFVWFDVWEESVDQRFTFKLKLWSIRWYAEFDSHEVVEKYPLVRVELVHFHDWHHFDKFKCCPDQIEFVLIFFNVSFFENIDQQEHDHLPDIVEQLG